METQGQCDAGFVKVLVSLVGVLAITLLLTATARAETLAGFQPRALADAELALGEGEPERALAHLHRGRVLLRQARFRTEADVLACQAYRQLEDWRTVSRVCHPALAYDREGGRVTQGGTGLVD